MSIVYLQTLMFSLTCCCPWSRLRQFMWAIMLRPPLIYLIPSFAMFFLVIAGSNGTFLSGFPKLPVLWVPRCFTCPWQSMLLPTLPAVFPTAASAHLWAMQPTFSHAWEHSRLWTLVMFISAPQVYPRAHDLEWEYLIDQTRTLFRKREQRVHTGSV